MFENVDNLKLLSIREGISPKLSVFDSRYAHCFVLKLSGKSKYEMAHDTIYLEEGSALYIPQKCKYRVIRQSEKESRYIVIDFHADMPEIPAQLLRFPNYFDPLHFFNTLCRLWVFDEPAKIYQCYAIFYSLLAELTYCQGYYQKKMIKESIAYLEQHIFDVDISISKMIACSKISETYFRQLFHSIYGVSPKQYIQSKRLAQAYTILASGDYTNIQSVANLVGYDDALYFSRAFKQKYGISPSQIKHPQKPTE